MADHRNHVLSARLSPALGIPAQLADAAPVRSWLAWRGLALASPQRLEPVEPDRSVAIAQRFLEDGRPMLRLVHPDKGTTGDWSIRFLVHGDGAEPSLALLELAPGWIDESEGRHQTLVEIEDRDTLRTLGPDEFGRALHRLHHELDAHPENAVPRVEEDLGFFPEARSPELVGLTTGLERSPLDPGETPTGIACFDCGRAIDGPKPVCPHCGARRGAPPCPRCGAPVANALDARASYPKEEGAYAWNAGWDGCCAGCAHEFRARFEVGSGHPHPGSDAPHLDRGQSVVEIAPGESVLASAGHADHQPSLVITVRRAVVPHAAGHGPDHGRGHDPSLEAVAKIALTPEECDAVIEALEGPLRLLLLRRPWWRDSS